MFKAYGLVHNLLSNGIPVDWVINSGKSYSAADFTTTFRDVASGGTGEHAYRGGPFVVDSTNRPAALALIQAWQTAHPQVTVHETTAAFTANVERSLVAAPRIAVLADGSEDLAFTYLNAAAIPDSRGVAWPPGLVYSGYVDILSPSDVAGPTTANHRDGLLFDANGVPLFSGLVSAHWALSTGTQDESIAEIGEFLQSRTLLFAECQAAITLESKGRFLTDQALTVTARPTAGTVVHSFAGRPLAQADGVFGTVGGSVPSFVPAGIYLGSEGTECARMLRGTVTGGAVVDVLVDGYALQNTTAGRVVYLGGHQYPVTLPLSVNPSSNGVRYFLNALFAAPVTALGDGSPALTMTLTGPSSPTGNAAMDYSLTYANSGQGAAFDTRISLPIPPNTAASMISGGGTVAGGEIVWTLGNLAAGQPSPAGVLTFRLDAASAGTYSVTATASYRRGITPATSSVTVVTDYAAPASLTATGGTPQSTVVNTAFGSALQATVRDSAGRGLSNVVINYAAPATGARATVPGSAQTAASGIAAVNATANGIAGSYDVTASVGMLTARFVLTNTPPTPTGVVATATSPTSVAVSWTATAGATYEVLRVGAGGASSIVGTSTTSALSDNAAGSNTAYLYQVRAIAPAVTPYSTGDLATTTMFTDPTLTASMVIKADHISQLRTAVRAVRTLAGSGVFSFTDAIVTPGATVIRALHIVELRTALDEARSTLQLPAIVYTTPSLTPGLNVAAADVNDLRGGVR